MKISTNKKQLPPITNTYNKLFAKSWGNCAAFRLWTVRIDSWSCAVQSTQLLSKCSYKLQTKISILKTNDITNLVLDYCATNSKTVGYFHISILVRSQW